MVDMIEQDALNDLDSVSPPVETHDHDEAVKSIVMTPRNPGSLDRLKAWWKSELKPGIHVVRKDNDPLRYMFLITSNSYEDREKETITTEALKAYEASCYPGDGLYHNDNPLIFWHDDDVVMGEIVAVNVSGPFLVEVAKEINTPIAKVLWDVAEQTEGAGVSHRFGYLEKDRDTSGTFSRIFKQETTWLPQVELAANRMTYAGVVGMASPASDKWLNDTFERITGIKGAAEKIHAKTGEVEKELEALGVSHKAFPPKAPVEAAVEAADVIEDEVEEDAKADLPMPEYMGVVNQILTLIMSLVDSQMEGVNAQMGMAKAFDELKELRMSEKAADKVTMETLQKQITEMQTKLKSLEDFRSLTPKRAADHVPVDVKSVSAAVEAAEKARKDGDMEDNPMFGKLKPAPKYD